MVRSATGKDDGQPHSCYSRSMDRACQELGQCIELEDVLKCLARVFEDSGVEVDLTNMEEDDSRQASSRPCEPALWHEDSQCCHNPLGNALQSDHGSARST